LTQPDSDQDDLEKIICDPYGDSWEDELVDQATTLECLFSMYSLSIDDDMIITHWLSVGRCL